MEKALSRVAALENELAALRGSAQKPNDLEEERKRKEADPEEMKRKVIEGDLGRWILSLGLEGEELEDLVVRFIKPGVAVKDPDLHTHTHTHTHTHAHTHTIRIYICVHIYTCVCIYVCMHVCMHECICVCVCVYV